MAIIQLTRKTVIISLFEQLEFTGFHFTTLECSICSMRLSTMSDASNTDILR